MQRNLWRAMIGLALAAGIGAAAARDIFIEPDAPIVALVLGDTLRLRNPDDVRRAIVARLLERYAAEKGIVAEPAEVEAQAQALRQTMRQDRARWGARLEEIERRLLERTLRAAERKSLLAERDVLVSLLNNGSASPTATPPLEDPRILKPLASGIVLQWKLDRALYQQYGGRVALQPEGPEPFEAMRRFLEERRGRGDFQLLVAEIDRAFWAHYLPGSRQLLPSGSPEEARAFSLAPWQVALPANAH